MKYSFPFSLMRLRKSITDAEVKALMGSSAIVQKKYDGHLVQMSVQSGKVQIFSRRGNDLTSRLKPLIPGILRQVKSDGVYLGELVAGKKNHTLGAVQSIASSAPARAAEIAKSESARIVLFDKIFNAKQSVGDQPYRQRLADLRKSVSGRGPLSKIKNYKWSDRNKASKESVKEGGEGIVIKDPNAPYKASSLGDTEKKGGQWKRKALGTKDQSDDFVLYDYDWGKEKAIFLAGQYDTGGLVHVGKISGLDKATEKQVVKRIDSGEHVVVEANYQQKTPAGKYRHLSWSRLRDDKPERSVTMPKRNPTDSQQATKDIVELSKNFTGLNREYGEAFSAAGAAQQRAMDSMRGRDSKGQWSGPPFENLAELLSGLSDEEITKMYSLQEWESTFGPLGDTTVVTDLGIEALSTSDGVSLENLVSHFLDERRGDKLWRSVDRVRGDRYVPSRSVGKIPFESRITAVAPLSFGVGSAAIKADARLTGARDAGSLEVFEDGNYKFAQENESVIQTVSEELDEEKVALKLSEILKISSTDERDFISQMVKSVDAVILITPYYHEEFDDIPIAQKQGITDLAKYAEQVISETIEQEDREEQLTTDIITREVADFVREMQVDQVELLPHEYARQYRKQFGFGDSRRLSRFQSTSTYGYDFVRLSYRQLRDGRMTRPDIVIDIFPAVSAYFVKRTPVFKGGFFDRNEFTRIPFPFLSETPNTVEEAKDAIFDDLHSTQFSDGVIEHVVTIDSSLRDGEVDDIYIFASEDDARNFLFVARGMPRNAHPGEAYVDRPLFEFSSNSWGVSIAHDLHGPDGSRMPLMPDKYFEQAVIGKITNEPINAARIKNGEDVIKTFEDVGVAMAAVKEMMYEGDTPLADNLMRRKDNSPIMRTKKLGMSVYGAQVDPYSRMVRTIARRENVPLRVCFPEEALSMYNRSIIDKRQADSDLYDNNLVDQLLGAKSDNTEGSYGSSFGTKFATVLVYDRDGKPVKEIDPETGKEKLVTREIDVTSLYVQGLRTDVPFIIPGIRVRKNGVDQTDLSSVVWDEDEQFTDEFGNVIADGGWAILRSDGGKEFLRRIPTGDRWATASDKSTGTSGTPVGPAKLSADEPPDGTPKIEWLSAFSDTDSPEEVGSWLSMMGAERVLFIGLKTAPVDDNGSLLGDESNLPYHSIAALEPAIEAFVEEVIIEASRVPFDELSGEMRDRALAMKPELSPQTLVLEPDRLITDEGAGLAYTEAFKTALEIMRARPDESSDAVSEMPFYVGKICQGGGEIEAQYLYAIEYDGVTYYIAIQRLGETSKYSVFTESDVTLLEKQIDKRSFDHYLRNQARWEMNHFGVGEDILEMMKRKSSYTGTLSEIQNYGHQINAWAQWYSSSRLLPFLMNWRAYRNDEYAQACTGGSTDRYLIGSNDKNVLAPDYMSGSVSEVSQQLDIGSTYTNLMQSKEGTETRLREENVARFVNIFDRYGKSTSGGLPAVPVLLPSSREGFKDSLVKRMMYTYMTDQAIARSYFAATRSVQKRYDEDGLDQGESSSFRTSLPELFKSTDEYFNGPVSPYSFVYAPSSGSLYKRSGIDSGETRYQYEATVTPFWAGLSIFTDVEGMRGLQESEYTRDTTYIDTARIILDGNSTIGNALLQYNNTHGYFSIAGAVLVNANSREVGRNGLLAQDSPYADSFTAIPVETKIVWEFEPEDLTLFDSASYSAYGNAGQKVSANRFKPNKFELSIQLRSPGSERGLPYLEQLSESGIKSVVCKWKLFSRSLKQLVMFQMKPQMGDYANGAVYRFVHKDPETGDNVESMWREANGDAEFIKLGQGFDKDFSKWQLSTLVSYEDFDPQSSSGVAAKISRKVALSESKAQWYQAFRNVEARCMELAGSSGLVIYVCPIRAREVDPETGKEKWVQVGHAVRMNAFPEILEDEYTDATGENEWVSGARRMKEYAVRSQMRFIFVDPATFEARKEAVDLISDYVQNTNGEVSLYFCGPTGAGRIEEPGGQLVAELATSLLRTQDQKKNFVSDIPEATDDVEFNPREARTQAEVAAGDFPSFYFVVDRPDDEFESGEDLLFSERWVRGGKFNDRLDFDARCDEVAVGVVHRSFRPPSSLASSDDQYADEILREIESIRESDKDSEPDEHRREREALESLPPLSDDEKEKRLGMVGDALLGISGIDVNSTDPSGQTTTNPSEQTTTEPWSELDDWLELQEKAESNNIPFITGISGETNAETLDGDAGYAVGNPDLLRMHFAFEIVPYSSGSGYADSAREYVTLTWSVPGIDFSKPLISKVAQADPSVSLGRDGAVLHRAVIDIVTKRLEDRAVSRAIAEYAGGEGSVDLGARQMLNLQTVMSEMYPFIGSKLVEGEEYEGRHGEREAQSMRINEVQSIVSRKNKVSTIQQPGVMYGGLFPPNSPGKETQSLFLGQFELNSKAEEDWERWFDTKGFDFFDAGGFWENLYGNMPKGRVRRDRDLTATIVARSGEVFERTDVPFSATGDGGEVEFSAGTFWACEGTIMPDDDNDSIRYGFRSGVEVVEVYPEELGLGIFKAVKNNLVDLDSYTSAAIQRAEDLAEKYDRDDADVLPMYVVDIHSNLYQVIYIINIKNKQRGEFKTYKYTVRDRPDPYDIYTPTPKSGVGIKGAIISREIITVSRDPDYEFENSPDPGAFKIAWKEDVETESGASRKVTRIEYVPTLTMVERMVDQISGGTAVLVENDTYRALLAPSSAAYEDESDYGYSDQFEINLTDMLLEYAPIMTHGAMPGRNTDVSYPALWVEVVKDELNKADYEALQVDQWTAKREWPEFWESATLTELIETQARDIESVRGEGDALEILAGLEPEQIIGSGPLTRAPHGGVAVPAKTIREDTEVQNPRQRSQRNPCIGLHFHSDDMDAVLRAIEDKNRG